MKYDILDVREIAGLLSVTIAGSSPNLRNGSVVKDSYGNLFVVKSIAMIGSHNVQDILKSTTMVISPVSSQLEPKWSIEILSKSM